MIRLFALISYTLTNYKASLSWFKMVKNTSKQYSDKRPVDYSRTLIFQRLKCDLKTDRGETS